MHARLGVLDARARIRARACAKARASLGLILRGIQDDSSSQAATAQPQPAQRQIVDFGSAPKGYVPGAGRGMSGQYGTKVDDADKTSKEEDLGDANYDDFMGCVSARHGVGPLAPLRMRADYTYIHTCS